MTVAELVTIACQLEPQAFAQRFEHPILLHVGTAPKPNETPFGFSTRVFDMSLMDVPLQRPGTVWLNNAAYAVKKSQGDPYQSWVSVGRARTSDVRIESPHVSKFHGYFSAAGADYVFTDVGSKNGSWVDGLRLEPRSPLTLPNDCLIVVGTHLLRYFGNPRSLWAYLTGSEAARASTTA